MAKFCGKCGAKLDDTTGLCPNCDADKLKEQSDKSEAVDVVKSTQETAPKSEKPLSKKETKKKRKADKKAKKKEKHAQWSTGKKIRRFFLKFILTILLIAIITAGAAGALVYFDVVDIPAIEKILNEISSISIDQTTITKTTDETILMDFTANENYFWEDERYDVTFSVLVKQKRSDFVDLYSEDTFVSQMYDNGANGDLVANDGIYSCTIPVSADLGSISYYSKLGENTSDLVYLYFFEKPTEQSVTETKQFQNEIAAIEQTFCNSSGYVEESNLRNAISEVEKYAEKLHKNGDVLYYESSESSVLFKFKNGVTYLYIPKRYGIDAINDNTNISVLTLQPCLNTYSADINDFLILPDLSAKQVCDTLKAYSFQNENNYDNQEVTLDLIKSFSKNQVVIWHGHGGYTNSLHSFLLTGEKFDWNEWWWNPIYCLDSLQNRIVECSNGNVAFTSKYIEKYCNDMDGSFFYLAACQSGKDNKLADSFIKKGAEAVVANSETIYTIYNLQVQNATLVNMTQVNNETGNLYTLSEALVKAKEKLGENDSVYGDKKEIATPLIFGGQNADNFTFTNNMSNISDQVPSDAVEFNGHYYYVYDLDTVTTWEEAKEYCESQGGYLATITNAEEDAFLYSYLTEAGYSSAMFGLTDQEQPDNWHWVTGEKLSYQNWRSGEPNHQGGYEHYGMYYKKNTDGTWNDGSGKGGPFICEWGEYQVAPDSQPQEPIRTTSDERDIVLVLDTSGSMSGTPMEETKKAATKFVNTILEEDASIGIVTYEDSANRLSDFSVDKEYLTGKVANISDGGGTNIESGLAEAKSMLDSSNAKKKIIVLMSDGEPNEGKEGEDLIAYADDIKSDDILIYTLGFFENMSGSKSSAQYLMEQLASDGCHYEVASADDLVFFFEDMADQINGQKYIYVRIACPVDVSVTYNGETLSSAENALNVRTDFGTLTFEDNENATSDDEDDRIKVLRLKEGADYDVQIIGTGRGMMDYTIGFMDENGDYNDFRRFENVKITKQTMIDTVAAVSDESVLNIDENGDGKYDVKLRAKENGYGEEVKTSVWIYVGIAGGAVLLVIIVLAVVKVRKNKKKGTVKS